MRYWVYINGQILERPFEREELSLIQGFTGETLICPEVVPAGTAQEWVAANVIFPPVQEQPVFGMPQPQALPPYYQYPQQQAYVPPQQQAVPPYQTTRMPIYAVQQPQPQPVYNPYPAQQTQYNQPVYQQPAQNYEPAEQTQNFDGQDMFDAPQPSENTISSVSSAAEAELLQKIEALTKEVEEVKQKLYFLSDNLQYSGAEQPQQVAEQPHPTAKEHSSRSVKKEQPSKDEDEVALPAGYIDDIPEVSQEDTEQAVNTEEAGQEAEVPEVSDTTDAADIKDMDTLLAGAAAVSPSEDFLQDAINTTFSNKHKKEAVSDPNAIVDLAKKENTDSKMKQQQIGTVVTDGNDLSEDDIPTVEEEFDAKLSFTQANLGKPQQEDEDFPAEEQEPLPEDLSQHGAPQGTNSGVVREITEELLNEPPSSQRVLEEGEVPFQQETEDYAAQEHKPFEIEPSSEAKDHTETATLEEVFNEQPEEVPQQAPLAEEEQPLEFPQEEQPLPQEEAPLPSDVEHNETDGIPQEVPSAQNIGETEDDISYRDNESQQEQQEIPEDLPQQEQQDLVQEPIQETPEYQQPQQEQPEVEQEVLQEDQPLEQEEPLISAEEQEDDKMNIETSQNAEENNILQEFADDKKQLEENTKDMTSSAFDVISSSSQEGDSALDELTGNNHPAVGPMPAEGEDQFLKTFTSSIEEVFLDQPTSIISDYVPPAQASDAAEDFDSMDVIASGTDSQDKGNVNLMDLKSAPQEDNDALKKVRRIKPAAIKTVPMVAASGGDLPQGQNQPDIEEAIAELGGNSILEKSLKTFGTISGLLIILLLFIALLAVMHIIPVRLSPAHYLLSKVFKKPSAEETTANNAVDASVAEALKEREAKLAAEQEIVTKVKNYKLGDGSSLEQKILSIHPKDVAQIEWTADQAVDPSYYSIAAKLPPNQEGYSLTYRFSYNTMDNTLVPTTSEANNIIQAAALAGVSQQPQQQAPQASVNQMPSVRRPGTGLQ